MTKIKKVYTPLIISFLCLTLTLPNSSANVVSQSVGAGSSLSNVAPSLMPAYQPLTIQGMTIDPHHALEFELLLNTGGEKLKEKDLQRSSLKFARYFLSALTIPEKDLWVNLSPGQEDRIIQEQLGETEMGRDLLIQDYFLKQLTASLLAVDTEQGQAFWEKLYQVLDSEGIARDINLDLLNRVWIVPDEALIYEHDRTAFIVKSRLKVLLEEDYVTSRKTFKKALGSTQVSDQPQTTEEATRLMREIILPFIEDEVNTGANFASLRQIYHSMILATWYKRNLKESLLGQVFADQHKVEGIDTGDKDAAQKIYQQYMKDLKKGVYHQIREDYDPTTQSIIPRKYFSGGFQGKDLAIIVQEIDPNDSAFQTLIDRAMTASFGNNRSARFGLLESDPAHRDVIEQAQENLFGEDAAMVAADFRQNGMKFADDDFNAILERYEGRPTLFNVGLEAFLHTLGETAQIGQGAGGLGFLQGENLRAVSSDFINFGHFGVFPMYERTQKGKEIDWDQEIADENIKPLMMKQGDKQPQHLQVSVQFRDNQETVMAKIYWTNIDGTPVLLIRAEESGIFPRLYPGQAKSRDRLRLYGFFARAFVELVKELNRVRDLQPAIVHLNEPQLLLTRNAMVNDRNHFNGDGKKGLFENTQIVVTTHTQQWAGLLEFKGSEIDNLRAAAGNGLVLGDNFTGDSRINALEAMARAPEVRAINAVSDDHLSVVKGSILPGRDHHKLVAIQNGSHPAQWRSDRLNALIKEKEGDLQAITGRELVDIGQDNKKDLIEYLKTKGVAYADQVDPNRFCVGLMRRWVEYKSQGLLIPLVEWILGDPEKDYTIDIDGNSSLMKGLGANLFLGGVSQDGKGQEWMNEFKRLQDELHKRDDIKGRLIVFSETGIANMKAFAAGLDAWLEIPWPTQEASGTSGMRAAFNGKPGIFSPTGHALAWVKNRKNSWVFDLTFKEIDSDGASRDLTDVDVMRGFHTQNQKVITQYYVQAQTQLLDYLGEQAAMYNKFRASEAGAEREAGAWEEVARQAFRDSHDRLSIDEMVYQYDLLFSHVHRSPAPAVASAFMENQDRRQREKRFAWELRAKYFSLESKPANELLTALIADVARIGDFISRDVAVPLLDQLAKKLTQWDIDPKVIGLDSARANVTGRSSLDLIDSKQPRLTQTAGVREDPAVLAVAPGGIDLDSAMLNLTIKRDDKGIPLSISEQPIQIYSVSGFLPYYIASRPVDLRVLLGAGE